MIASKTCEVKGKGEEVKHLCPSLQNFHEEARVLKYECVKKKNDT